MVSHRGNLSIAMQTPNPAYPIDSQTATYALQLVKGPIGCPGNWCDPSPDSWVAALNSVGRSAYVWHLRKIDVCSMGHGFKSNQQQESGARLKKIFWLLWRARWNPKTAAGTVRYLTGLLETGAGWRRTTAWSLVSVWALNSLTGWDLQLHEPHLLRWSKVSHQANKAWLATKQSSAG